jgi:tRNA-(ms[2]io[6]A)-hydroxylase
MPVLAAPTPPEWLQVAREQWPLLLVDHANCEKKAASSALALIFAYPEREQQNLALARLAREELRHFEQVTRLMQRMGVPFQRLRPGRYAAGLRRACASAEPDRELDLMLTGALIEARSCERFRLLSPMLPDPLGQFYADLERAESRHCSLYLQFAAARSTAADPGRWQRRLSALAGIEAELVCSPDEQFRFHSGLPRGNDCSA